jgi:hypothetical protein
MSFSRIPTPVTFSLRNRPLALQWGLLLAASKT